VKASCDQATPLIDENNPPLDEEMLARARSTRERRTKNVKEPIKMSGSQKQVFKNIGGWVALGSVCQMLHPGPAF
jgi:hypothetical protein